jgi:histone demethylase JARID1
MSSLSTSLRNSYQRWLFPYEEYLRLAKPGVHQQLEYEYGGPLTPSPANSPMKKSHQHTPSSLRGDSPAIRASEALNSTMKGEFEKGMTDIPMLDAPIQQQQHQQPPPAPPVTSGFTAVNAGGFTPVNSAPATFTPVSMARRDREESSSFTPIRRPLPFDSPVSSAKNTPEYRPSALSSAPVVNGFTSNPLLKRQMSQDTLESRNGSQPPEDGDSQGRRSKRLKKGMSSLSLSFVIATIPGVKWEIRMVSQGCVLVALLFPVPVPRLAKMFPANPCLQMPCRLWLVRI